jgi:hypothetical protein
MTKQIVGKNLHLSQRWVFSTHGAMINFYDWTDSRWNLFGTLQSSFIKAFSLLLEDSSCTWLIVVPGC